MPPREVPPSAQGGSGEQGVSAAPQPFWETGQMHKGQLQLTPGERSYARGQGGSLKR